MSLCFNIFVNLFLYFILGNVFKNVGLIKILSGFLYVLIKFLFLFKFRLVLLLIDEFIIVSNVVGIWINGVFLNKVVVIKLVKFFIILLFKVISKWFFFIFNLSNFWIIFW